MKLGNECCWGGNGDGGGSGRTAVAALLGNTSVVNRLRRARAQYSTERAPPIAASSPSPSLSLSPATLCSSPFTSFAPFHTPARNTIIANELYSGGASVSVPEKRAVVPKWAERRWLAEVVGSQPQLFSRPE
jgi:hypothetical protein